jgi:BirA family transcriptional regulator, biotin operon repressor / biotin---[acetyl-CoA-carboxylase] ligase
VSQRNPGDNSGLDSSGIRNQIIQTFLQAGNSFVSGTDLSEQVGISRTAVWKHIQALEALGFTFESTTRMGYRLLGGPNLVLEPLLKRALSPGGHFGTHVIWRNRVDSTNVVAAQLAREGLPHGTVVAAMEQTGGRGRRGKAWFSPPEGLWFSIVLNHPIPLRRAAELTLLTSVAVHRSLVHQTELPVQIKWPNDLLVYGKKLCGILAEIRADGENVQHAVVGIGINTNIPRTDFPQGIDEIATSVLAQTDVSVNHADLVADILSNLEPLYDSLVQGGAGFLQVIDEWRAACSTLGKSIRVQTAAGMLEGLAKDIDDSGVLYIEQANGQVIPIHSGDILFGQ